MQRKKEKHVNMTKDVQQQQQQKSMKLLCI